MSTIVFNRVRNHTQALEVDQEEELDAETYCTSIDSNVDSSNFLPIVHRVNLGILRLFVSCFDFSFTLVVLASTSQQEHIVRFEGVSVPRHDRCGDR